MFVEFEQRDVAPAERNRHATPTERGHTVVAFYKHFAPIGAMSVLEFNKALGNKIGRPCRRP